MPRASAALLQAGTAPPPALGTPVRSPRASVDCGAWVAGRPRAGAFPARPGPGPARASSFLGQAPRGPSATGPGGGPRHPRGQELPEVAEALGSRPTPWILFNMRSLLSGQCTGDQAQGWGSSAEGASKGRVRAGGLGVRLGQATEKGTGKASSSQGAMLPPSAGRWAEGPSGQCLTSSLRLPDPQALPRPCHGVF